MKKFLIICACIILYLVSAVPVGLFLYSFKMDLGIDVFSKTGFHGFMYCLQTEGKKAIEDEPDAQ
ncbi:MAG: hypothetical protein A3B66_06930 [Alphaproteobacteria bacterium RIFCSPHIGHO2_02_FULL_46_13]|nr:MAG: hypothetical protein A3B66_06930 [Alphaproteobacteria bacterium RIFCSPHIGHO2_02_FULL_46_13]